MTFRAEAERIMYDWVSTLLELQDKDLRISRLQEQIRSAPAEKHLLQHLGLADARRVIGPGASEPADG